jgi:SAM-dependent methyltransferase
MEASTSKDAPVCPACGAANRAGALFCDRCTYPLSVAKLTDLTEADRRLCLSSLLEELAGATRSPEAGASIDADLWNAYLSAFWLRPETAIIEYSEATAIRDFTPAATRLNESSNRFLDLGCGDGIHTAIYSGFRFDEAFDAFQALDLTKPDLYDHFEAARFQATIVRGGEPVDVGFDIKATAIARATALRAIGRVERADATKLPLRDASVDTIFSNMLRDLGEPLDAALGECARVLTGSGTLLLSTMTPAYAESLVFAPAAREADKRGDRAAAEQLLRLDRGRSVFCRRQLWAAQWDELLLKHGFHVERTVPILGREATRLWDVGLRPFSAELLAWRQTADLASLLAVKRAAVAILDRLLRPIIARATLGEPCMQLLVVRKAVRKAGRP